MKNKFELALRITSDLMTYCHNHGATDYKTKMNEGEDAITFLVQGHPVNISEAQLEDVNKKLHAPRQRDVENDFWELIGESEDFCELMLVGMSCDSAEVEYENERLTFTLLRYL
ncbi:MAG: hypothetical protein FWD05_09615 [Oscillospiraceae bacterium]|nr:hypothetical protein [Oscillospiraceae bacterium]